ncbi:hypothetical protein AHMF7616_04973 [Adhaeribacter pallidiroseus]|uniref:Uncharacterized protein n=1 Tax=Adhaeribacter pallidiroseus TaxID=2072847 RepID=A0A369QPV4_9BACT|nr:hypothetical protein AHMF7616_04973 [Adhaeribacter pallidiroseus]
MHKQKTRLCLKAGFLFLIKALFSVGDDLKQEFLKFNT